MDRMIIIESIKTRIIFSMDISKEEALNNFVCEYAGMIQRDTSWYDNMKNTIGGSEMAAIMGINPYSSYYDIVINKINLKQGLNKWNGGEACWWGTMFEDIIASFVEIDLGGKVVGDNICLQPFPGFRTSPDGYIIAKFTDSAKTKLVHYCSGGANSSSQAAHEAICLLEFKCPLSRKPTTSIPKYYVPQLWSGLAVSPIAEKAIFVDSIFRKCSVKDLNLQSCEIDEIYHKPLPKKLKPIAWGYIAVYAPMLTAERSLRILDSYDTSMEALDLYSQCLKLNILESQKIQENGGCNDSFIDFGTVSPKQFAQTLKFIDNKKYKTIKSLPKFNGSYDYTCEKIIDYWFIGVIPWKLFDVKYILIDRNPTFLDDIIPKINAIHALVDEALIHPNPIHYVDTIRYSNIQPQKITKDEQEELQDVFDNL